MKQKHSFRRSVLIFTSIYCIGVFLLTMGILTYLTYQFASRKLKTSLTESVYNAAVSLENGGKQEEFSEAYGYTIQISLLNENKEYIGGNAPQALRNVPLDLSGLRTVKADHRIYYVLDLQIEDAQGNICYLRGCTDNTFFFNGLYFGAFECDLSGKYSDVIIETRAMAEKCSYLANTAEIPSSMLWYSKGVCFSIYDADSVFVCGRLPQGFRELPVNTAGPVFSDEGSRDYISYDIPVTLANGEEIYVRGVSHFAEFSNAVQSIFRSAFLLVPLLLLLFVVLLQWMLARALRPVSAVIAQTRNITGGRDLSRRVMISEQSEEFQALTDTMNNMLERLQDSFQQEARFSGDAAHELRNPLAVILSESEYLLEEAEVSREVRNSLQCIYDHASRLNSLIHTLLSLSRMENECYPLEFETVDLCMLIPSVMEEYQSTSLEKHISMNFTCREEELCIIGDMNLLIEIAANLIQNAVKYGRENGHVQITLEKEKEQVILKVCDDGIGISAQDCAHIFDRFYRADPSRTSRGYGLGLNLVQWAVRLHHGSISVKSCLHQGTVFTVKLPVQLNPSENIPACGEKHTGPLL